MLPGLKFKCLAQNPILSINSNSIIGKIDIIRAHVHTYQPDLVAISETKIDSKFDDNELLGDGYTIWRKDRKHGGGGVLIALSNTSNLSVLQSNEGPGESLALLLQIHPMLKFRVVVMYRPPNEYDLENFENLIDEYKLDNCIFVGDYNFPDLDWITVREQ